MIYFMVPFNKTERRFVGCWSLDGDEERVNAVTVSGGRLFVNR